MQRWKNEAVNTGISPELFGKGNEGMEESFPGQILGIENKVPQEEDFSIEEKNKKQRIAEIRGELGLPPEEEEAHDIFDDMTEEEEDTYFKERDRSWTNLSGKPGPSTPGLLGGIAESDIFCGLCGQKGHGRAECPNAGKPKT